MKFEQTGEIRAKKQTGEIRAKKQTGEIRAIRAILLTHIIGLPRKNRLGALQTHTYARTH
ncbi:MAG: hypothetical protein GY820_35560, partial [Gammaproteobacteria bacterium]|nr:hypothetical protein [Gammaproteobacteria bacterium]